MVDLITAVGGVFFFLWKWPWCRCDRVLISCCDQPERFVHATQPSIISPYKIFTFVLNLWKLLISSKGPWTLKTYRVLFRALKQALLEGVNIWDWVYTLFYFYFCSIFLMFSSRNWWDQQPKILPLLIHISLLHTKSRNLFKWKFIMEV